MNNHLTSTDHNGRCFFFDFFSKSSDSSAYGGPQYKVVSDVMASFANDIKEGKIDIVPKTLVSTGSNTENGGANAFESLIMLLLSEKFTEGEFIKEIDEVEQIKKIKDEIMNQISNMESSLKDENIRD